MTYSSSLAVSRNRYSGRNKNSVSFAVTNRRVGPVSNTIILVVLACLLGLIYLTQVTKTNTYGYQIEGLQAQQQQLESQKQNLQVAQAQLQSLNKVQSSNVAKNMVAVTPTATVTQ
jgi:cell division protein FtsL